MKYLKMVNAPVRGNFPEKENNRIDWEAAGFDKEDLRRSQYQGNIDANTFVSLFPIDDEAKLAASGIVASINNNKYPDDSAEVIEQSAIDPIKAQIEAYAATLTS